MNNRFDIVGHKVWWFAISGILIVAGIISLCMNGLNLGIDFTGGTIFDLRFPAAVQVADIRATLDGEGLKNAMIQQSESDKDIFIRTKIMNKDEQAKVIETLSKNHGQAEVRRVEMVGPVIGEQLAKQSLMALGIAAIGIVIYVSIRFQLNFAVASILAVLHDAFIVVGIFSILQKEVDVTFVAAILTIVGYSINDTIVIFDRIRENMKSKSKKESVKDMMNRSIYQSMTRSIYTPMTVMFTLLALYFFGGETLNNFTLTMILGVLVGTYSSIFTATPIVHTWMQVFEGKK